VLHIGGNDLPANMGKPGKFDDPALVEAKQRVIAALPQQRHFRRLWRQPGRRASGRPHQAELPVRHDPVGGRIFGGGDDMDDGDSRRVGLTVLSARHQIKDTGTKRAQVNADD
jgi:hypothetical protein